MDHHALKRQQLVSLREAAVLLADHREQAEAQMVVRCIAAVPVVEHHALLLLALLREAVASSSDHRQQGHKVAMMCCASAAEAWSGREMSSREKAVSAVPASAAESVMPATSMRCARTRRERSERGWLACD